MFNNIGKKLKGLAKFICWFGIVLGALIAIIAIVAGMIASVEMEEPLIIVGAFIAALLYFGLVFLVYWISSWTLYGYGELVDKIASIDKRLENGTITVKVVGSNMPASAPSHNIPATTVLDSAPQNEIEKTEVNEAPAAETRQKYKCPTCNADVYMGDNHCGNCGQKFNWDNL